MINYERITHHDAIVHRGGEGKNLLLKEACWDDKTAS